MFKKIISSLLAVAIVATMSTTVFANDSNKPSEAIPDDMVVTATITDEFNQVTNVDVKYTITEIPNLSRAGNANKRYMLTAESHSNRDTQSKDGVDGSITIYYEKTFGWLPISNKYCIYTLAGYWYDNGQSLSNRSALSYSTGSGTTNYYPDPAYNSYSYNTGYTELKDVSQTYASSSVTINGSSTFTISIRPN